MARIEGISLKKSLGQHFLEDLTVIEHMLEAVEINKQTSIFEIGSGNGFLTYEILKTSCKKLWSFEIDEEWAQKLKKNIKDSRFNLIHTDFLEFDLELLKKEGSWTILANLPYYITFAILEKFVELQDHIAEGVIMIQEEVAQKIVASSGRSYGAASIYFQYFFDWKLLSKIPPEAFNPPPKVFSRLLYFKSRKNQSYIENKVAFFKFVRVCFKQPRRTLKNNLQAVGIDCTNIDEDILKLRAQQMNVNELLEVFNLIH